MLEKLERYARLRGLNEEEVKETLKDLRKKIKDTEPVYYHLNGYEFESLPAYTSEDPFSLLFLDWGLIPEWVQTKDKADQLKVGTLNAKCETLFEKPSFRDAAKNKRCLVMIDGFFEHHHMKGKTIPFYISHEDESPLMLAGIYAETQLEEGSLKTVSIVTTKANNMMTKIHNNPKLSEARMPVILKKENYENWLHGDLENDEVLRNKIFAPYDDHLLKAYTVRKLRDGRISLNNENAVEPFTYKELPLGLASIGQVQDGDQFSLF
ncbi:SOS response-associated peptidase [Jiulongibacter sp. NS-SX5]|uniref:SOS response-associated peptidase n=1 Tax=Jiulongibacter sp. NS-SX5 TaxID=3463854 RepID=UPI0040597D68